jgi:poly(3-hydroxybutyrate) depolymerase/sugar lactone lactonase YvrE
MKLHTLLVFIAILALGEPVVHGQQQAVRRTGGANERFTVRAFPGSSGQVLRYCLFVPEADGTGKLPLVLCLHGAGGNTAAANILASPEMQKKHPCIVMAPACDSKTARWVEVPVGRGKGLRSVMPELLEALDAVIQETNADQNRIYITGQSMGGIGSWGLIARHAEKFAAAVPVCGAWSPDDAPQMNGVAIWAFHGDQDKTVPVSGSRNMIAALKKAGVRPEPRYTELAGVGHGSWEPAYATTEMWDWLFDQRRPAKDSKSKNEQAHSAIDFRPVADFLKLPEGMKLGPCSGVDLDSRGNLYVIQRQSPPVLCFDSAGKFLRSWGTQLIGRDSDMQGAHGLRVDRDDFIWIVDRDRHLVRKFDPSGQLLLTIGTDGKPGTGANQFNRPADVSFGPSGEIYVADGYGNSRVVKFDATGKFLKTWGEKGTAPGQFDLPHSLAVGPDGRVYVCDRYNWRIQIFDSEGALQETWADIVAAGIVFGQGGELFVSDGISKVMLLDREGRIVRFWGHEPEELGLTKGQKVVPPIASPGGFRFSPHLFAADRQGNLYLADVPNQMLHKLERVMPPAASAQ